MVGESASAVSVPNGLEQQHINQTNLTPTVRPEVRSSQRFNLRQRLVAAGAVLLVSACSDAGASATPDNLPQVPGINQLDTSPSEHVLTGPVAQEHRSPGHRGLPPGVQPNFVFISADDLSPKEAPYMRQTNRLIGDKGVYFTMYGETSLCCPSRATQETGLLSHDTHVTGNTNSNNGGFEAFHLHDEKKALPTWFRHLHPNRRYNTGFIGKYFNGFPNEHGIGVSSHYVPDGWTYFAAPVSGNPYRGITYRMAVNGNEEPWTHVFMGDKIKAMTVNLVHKFINAKKPFLAYINPFSPHIPYTYPSSERNKFDNVRVPRTPAFNERDIKDKPFPLDHRSLLSRKQIRRVDAVFRDRVRAVQPIDQMVGNVVRTLRRAHELWKTYIIVTSDNGYFEGDHRKTDGKYDPLASIPVPFWMRGPGIWHNSATLRRIRQSEPISNIDIAPTLADAANVKPPYTPDGVSLLPLLLGKVSHLKQQFMLLARGHVPTYRKANKGIIEPPEAHPTTARMAAINDFSGVMGHIGGQVWKYIRYTRGNRAMLFNETTDPYELNNLLGAYDNPNRLNNKQKYAWELLKAAMPDLLNCSGVSCTLTVRQVSAQVARANRNAASASLPH